MCVNCVKAVDPQWAVCPVSQKLANNRERQQELV